MRPGRIIPASTIQEMFDEPTYREFIDKRNAELRRVYDAGMNFRQACMKMGVTLGAGRSILFSSLDYKPTRLRDKIESDKKRNLQILEYAKNHPLLSAKELGQKFQLKDNSIWEILRKQGYSKPKPSTIEHQRKVKIAKRMLMNRDSYEKISRKLHINKRDLPLLKEELRIIKQPTVPEIILKDMTANPTRITNIVNYARKKKFNYKYVNSSFASLEIEGKLIRIKRGYYQINPKYYKSLNKPVKQIAHKAN